MTMSPSSSTPAIRIYDHASRHHHPVPQHRRPSHPTVPGAMAIAGARDEVPPPLPPPPHIAELSQGQDLGWQWGNSNTDRFGGRPMPTVRPGSSLYGSPSSQQRRETSTSDSDEEHHGQSRPALQDYRFSSERQLGQKTLQSSSQLYDKQLLSKIGGPNTPSMPTRTTAPPLVSVAGQDSSSAPSTSFSKLNGQLKPLSVPGLDSPVSRWPPTDAFSGFRSPGFEPGSAVEQAQRRFGSLSTPGTLDDGSALGQQHRGSYDHSVFSDNDFNMEENGHGMRELNINDRTGAEEYQGSKAGVKRRASSPPSEASRDDRPTANHAHSHSTDLYHRRSAQMLGSRNSPVSRGPINPSSLSSASSLSQRTASFASSYTFSQASSLTSYNGDALLSPSALSPSAEAELGPSSSGPVSPYAASRSLHPSSSPRASLSRPHHQHGLSEHEQQAHIRKMSTDSILQSRHNSLAGRLPGAYMCECCPKKPKKFDSEAELRTHELEKQYTCQYCPNRFKNKNEAERHQNSLHLRRHSWSCAALAGVHAAFHPSITHPGAADVCGYCGAEFPNPPDSVARTEHLTHVHKFLECNQAKKFFRADHFRQHLKHSHAGTGGKWTNMLETACMRDEPAPLPLKERVGSIGSMAGSSAMASLAPKPDVINESQNE